jgi:thioredoxin 1
MSDQLVELTNETFDAAVGSGVSLVDFWAPWCGPCKMQTPILEQQVAPAMAGRAKLCKVNVDEAQELAVRFSVKGIPALFVFKDGQVVQQFVGLQRGDALVKALEAALGA